MYKWWPTPGLFVLAAFLFFKGCQLQESGNKNLAESAPSIFGSSQQTDANRDVNTGYFMQMAGVAAAAVGVVMLGLGLFHRQAQEQALAHRLSATYTFVPVIPVEGAPPDPSHLTEDQAVDELQSRHPTLARTIVDKLRREFAEKRRAEPTKIWYVKNLQVSEKAV